MNMADEKFNITLRVAGENFTLTIRRSDEQIYRDAAKLIDEKLNLYRSRYGENVADKQLRMVALTIAVNLKRNEHIADSTPIFERLELLDKDVVDLLK
jgi:cell division protein ZapA